MASAAERPTFSRLPSSSRRSTITSAPGLTASCGSAAPSRGARPRSAVGGAAPAVARPAAAGALFGKSLLGYISPDRARLNGNTFAAVSLPSAAARRCARPTPRRCSPVASVRRRPCSHQPETPDAVSSADLAFDQPLKGVPRSPGKTSASFASWRAPRTSPGPSDERACRSFLARDVGNHLRATVAFNLTIERSARLVIHRPNPSTRIPRAGAKTTWRHRQGGTGGCEATGHDQGPGEGIKRQKSQSHRRSRAARQPC
jgi:hypothetical protein